jgi:hypothetical protein
MSTPYHMQAVGDETLVLPEDVDLDRSSDDVMRVSVDMKSPGGTSELLVDVHRCTVCQFDRSYLCL